MQVDNSDVQEFRTLYTAEFGEELSIKEATEIAGRVADLYTLLAESLPSESGKATPLRKAP